MMTPATIEEFDVFLCDTCGHTAHRHALYVGPCAECWAQALVICKTFKPKPEDEEDIDALIARIQP